MRQRARTALVLVLCGLLAVGPIVDGLVADLEVGVPPGSPTDWIGGYPQPELTGLDRVPSAKVGQGSIEVTPWTRDGFRPAASIFDFSGITTRDLPMELPWSRPEVTKGGKKDVTLTGNDPRGRPQFRYPPRPSDYMHWLAMATLLRTVMHPAQVSDLATREHLTLLGHPAWLAARRAIQEPALKQLSQEIIRRVGTPPTQRPDAPRHKDPYVNMMFRLAWIELSAGVPYEPGRPFAPKLRWLGVEAMSAVVACSRSRHVVLRRNATTLLGKYRSEMVSARLRELMQDKDHVVRNRAIAAVGERGDKAASEALLKMLRSSDPGLVIQAAEALGRIGEQAAVKPLLELMARHDKRSADVWWACLPALARLAPKDPKVVGVLRRLVDLLKRDPRRFEPSKARANLQARVRADNPDPMTKTMATRQLGLIALAACGDAAAAKQLDEIIGGAAMAGADTAKQKQIAKLQSELNALRQKMVPLQQSMLTAPPAERLKMQQQLGEISRKWQAIYRELRKLDPTYVFRRQVRQGIVLKHTPVAGRYVLCRVLATRGKPGHQLLWRVVEDPSENLQLRAHALDLVKPTVLFGFIESLDKVKALAMQDDLPAMLRARALSRLEKTDPETALAVAKAAVQRYLDAPSAELPSMQHWDAIDALRLLGRRGKTDVPLLDKVVAHAHAEQLAAEAKRKAHEQQLKRMRQRMYQLDVKVFRVPPVLEVALLELGRLGNPAAKASLEKRLADTKVPGRPQAALALGAIPGKGVVPRLIELLHDADPFVRLMAYRALRRRTGQDHATDWIWAPDGVRHRVVKKWKAWLKTLDESR